MISCLFFQSSKVKRETTRLIPKLSPLPYGFLSATTFCLAKLKPFEYLSGFGRMNSSIGTLDGGCVKSHALCEVFKNTDDYVNDNEIS